MRALGVAICASLAFSGSAANGAGRCATLAIADRDPLTIRGARFAPNEKVKLLVSGQVQLHPEHQGRLARRLHDRVPGRASAAATPSSSRRLGSRGNRAQVDVTQTACAPPP